MRKAMQLPKRSVLLAGLALGAVSVISVSGCRNVAVVDDQQGTTAAAADDSTLIIDGVGEVRVQPDSLRALVSVEARAERLEDARQEAESKTRAVIQALEGLQLPSLIIRTVDINIRPVLALREPGDTTPPRIIAYVVVSTLSATLRGAPTADLGAQGSRILEAALSAGANAVGGIDFFLDRPREAHRLALAAAVEDAEKNARTMADQAGIRLVRLEHISGQSQPSFRLAQRDFAVSAEAPDAAGFPVEPGELVVTMEVNVRFRFAPTRLASDK